MKLSWKKVCFYGLMIIAIGIGRINGQLNIALRDQIDYTPTLADLWGYAADGREYAIVGMQTGISIVDITDPDNITELFFITSGNTSYWRQIRTWSHYAYIVHDAFSGNTDGMLIIDLAQLPNNITTYNHLFNSNGSKAHTIHIDENGVAYLMGGNTGGTIFLDLAANPLAPPQLGSYSNYVHDGYMKDNIFYAAQIYTGTMSVIDVSDFTAPVIINEVTTPDAFTHACWKTADDNHILTTDEVDGAYVTCYNTQDLTDIIETDRYRTLAGTGVVPHNVYVTDQNFAWVSYYTAGVVLLDVSNPYNIVEVGNYDTAPTLSGGGFSGCWGVYPYLPSGNVIASDRQNGLYVLTPTYYRAGYLSGMVNNSLNGSPINGAMVQVIGDNNATTYTNNMGQYATGHPGSGTYNLLYTASGYYPLTQDNITINQMSTTTLNVSMTPTAPCLLSPANLTTNTILNNEIQLVWSDDPNAIAYSIRYREQGQSMWSYIYDITSHSYDLEGLYPNTIYEIEISSYCSESVNSPYSNTEAISTLPGCIAPYNQVAGIGYSNSAIIYWDDYDGAAFFQIKYRAQGTNTWSYAMAESNSYLLEGLSNNTTYEVQVATNCGAALSAYNGISIFVSTGSGLRFRGTVLLEGFRQAGNSLLKTTLAENDLIPLAQPYNRAPYNYNGHEVVNTMPNNVCDWVLVELRSAVDYTQVIERRAAFLRNDGVLIDIDGVQGVIFDNINGNTSYYVVVYHQTHLGIMSSQSILLPNNQAYNWNLNVSNAMGIDQQKLIGTMAYMYAGDYDGIGVINNLDYNKWISANAAVNSYMSWDGDANGVINNLDYNLWYANRSKTGIPAIQY